MLGFFQNLPVLEVLAKSFGIVAWSRVSGPVLFNPNWVAADEPGEFAVLVNPVSAILIREVEGAMVEHPCVNLVSEFLVTTAEHGELAVRANKE